MKKLIIIVAAVCFGAVQANAQETTITKGTNIASLGIGFGGTLYSGLAGSGVSRTPAFSVSYERGIVDHLWDDRSVIGVGGILGYAHASYDYSGWGWSSNSFVIGARGALHYAFLDKLDTYTGLMLGYNIASTTWNGAGSELWGGSDSFGGFEWSWFVGARYYFTDQFAAFAELGYGIAILNIGVSMKF